MNSKTARMLRRFAAMNGLESRQAKRYWNRLSHKQKGNESARMKEQLSKLEE